jgi:tetratricopeptide (TPR) repeat protein
MAIEVKQLRHASKRVKGLYDRGVQAAEQKNYKYAIDMFREVLKKEPGILEVRDQLRSVQLERIGGSANMGRQALASVLTIPHMIKMPILVGKEDWEAALDLGEAAMTIDPTAPVCCKLLFQAADAADLQTVAMEALEFAHTHNPKSIGILDQLAESYSANGRGKKALECIMKIRQVMPNSKRYEERLREASAEAAMDDGGWTRLEQGEGDFRDVIKDKDEAAHLEQQGKTFLDKADIDNQIERQLRVAEKDRTMQNVRRLAEMYTEANRYEEALASYDDVIEIAGTLDPAIDTAITTIYGRQFDDAIGEWKEYLKSDELAEEERQNAEEQVASLEKQKLETMKGRVADRVRRYPNSAPDRMELAKMELASEEYDEALVNFQLCQKNPQFKQEETLSMGRCFAAKGQHDLALDRFQNALEEMKSMTKLRKETLYEMGKCHEAQGKSEEAGACFKEIYAVDLSFRDVAQIIERLYQGDGE